MTPERKFSELTYAYNANAWNLNEARKIFQNEINEFNNDIEGRLQEVCQRPNDEGKIKKVRWSDPTDWSTSKDGPWLNYIASTQVEMDIKPPSFKIFKRAAAYLYFEIRFDRDFSRFMFRCRLENQNSVHNNIDEKVMELISQKKTEEFPNAVHQKSNTGILFRHELKDDLFDILYQQIDNAIKVCEEAIDAIFPDSQYDNSEDIFEESTQ